MKPLAQRVTCHMWVWRPVLLVMLVTTLLAVGGCQTAAQRQAREVSEARKDVAREVDRICALKKEERERELVKLKKESGMVVQCGREAGAE